MSVVSSEIRFAPQLTAWFTANPTKVLQDGEVVYCSDGTNKGKYVIGDNSTVLSSLTFYGGVSTAYTASGGITLTGSNFALTSTAISQFTNDSGYITSAALSPYLTAATAASTYQPLATNLTSLSGLTYASASFVKMTAGGTFALDTNTYLTSSTGVTTVNGSSGAITNVALTTGTLSQFAATTSAQLAGVISDETGSGALVFGTSPTFTTNITTPAISLIGNLSSSAWTTSGIAFKQVASTFTDTSSSGTVALAYTNVFGGSTIAASSSTTYTDYYANYFLAPVVGSSVTMTRKYSIGSDNNVAFGISNSSATLHLGVAPSGSNWALSNFAGAGSMYLNAPSNGFVVLSIGTGNKFQVNNASITFNTSGGSTAGVATTCYSYSFSSNTNQTASTEIPGVLYNSYSRAWATGNITTQREFYIKTVTYTAIGSSTISNAYGVYIEAPTQSTNIVITNNWALGLKGGLTIENSGKLQLGNAATTGLSAGVLAGQTNASIVLYDSTGQAYRIPCII